MRRVLRPTLIAAALAGCGPTAPPKAENANVAWSPDAPKAERSFWTNQPSVAILEGVDQQGNGVRNRVVAAFDDAAGFWRRSGAFLVQKTDASLAGIAISDDFGTTWSRPTPRLAMEGKALLGGVWIASNQTAVAYTTLAGDGDPFSPDVNISKDVVFA